MREIVRGMGLLFRLRALSVWVAALCLLAVDAAAAKRSAVPRERPQRVEREVLAEQPKVVAPAATPPAPTSTPPFAPDEKSEPGGQPVSIVPPAVQPPPAESEKIAAPPKPGTPQAPGTLKPCEQVACRAPGKIAIARSNGSLVEIDQPGYPFVSPAGVVTVLPGEKIAVEFTQAAGKLTGAAYVAEVLAPDRTVTLELAKSDGSPALLTVTNPFPLPLKYDASIEVLARDGKAAKVKRTSTCAVAAQGSAFEMWPEAIVRVQVENFRLLPAGDESCK